MIRIALAAAVLAVLGACSQFMPSSNEPATAPAGSNGTAASGCGSGEPATFLHQNRPGGSDYSAVRCSEEGY